MEGVQQESFVLNKGGNHMDFNNDDLRVIKEALLTAKAQEETKYLEGEKRLIDSLPSSSNDDISAAKQDSYNRLLDKIKRYMEQG
jgi:hypothetical protein